MIVTPEIIDNTYLVINVSDLNLVDFSQVNETSIDSVRLSVDNTKTFISYVNQPTFFDDLTTKEGPYDHDTFMGILSTSTWSAPYPGI